MSAPNTGNTARADTMKGASAASGLKPIVAMSHDFLAQTAKLPAAIHAKVLKWAMLFQTDPTAPGINYETIQSRNPNLRSVRIDQDWRGIVHKPDRGNVYTLLYVDHHDDAYAWAKNRNLAINRVTGAMQMVVLETVTVPVPVAGVSMDAGVAAPSAAGVGLVTIAEVDAASGALQVTETWSRFDALTDHQLLLLGVPEDWLVRASGIANEAELDHLQAALPLEAYEGLFLVGAGDSVETVLNARETPALPALNHLRPQGGSGGQGSVERRDGCP